MCIAIVIDDILPHPGGPQSDILYTFLHQMIRDETDGYKMEEDCKYYYSYTTLYIVCELVHYHWCVVLESNSGLPVPPKVKLNISYNASDQLLSVMVGHVRNLVSELL